MANLAELLEDMSTDELNEMFLAGPYNHVRVFVTDAAEEELNGFTDKFVASFCKPLFDHLIRITRAIAATPGSELAVDDLARHTFQRFFDAFGSFADQMQPEDFERMMNQFATRLTINYLYTESVKDDGQELRSLTAVVDMVPTAVFDEEAQFNAFNQFRIIHESEENWTH